METACLWDYTSAVCRVIQMLLILVPVYLAEIGRAQFSNSTTSSTTAIPNVSATLTNSSETVNRTCKHRCKGSTACVSSWAEKCPNGCRYNQGRCGTTGPCVFATQFCVGNCLMIDQECADGSCVPRYSSCPGQCGPYERKCWDGSCGECSCPSYQPFKCGSQCIKQYQVCDGRRDCSDGTDEICNDNKGGNQEYSGDSGTLLMVALIAFAAFFVLIVGFVSILKKRKSGESQKTQRIDGQTPQSVVPGSGTPASRPGTRTARPATNFGSAAASVASGTQMHPVTDTESALSAETTGASTENTRVNFVMYDFQPDGTQSLADLPPSYDEVLSGKYNPPVHAEALNP